MTTDRDREAFEANQYRKKPVVIEARQFCSAFLHEQEALADWCGGLLRGTKLPADRRVIRIPTLEGEMEASFGDWIICGVKGEFYPCKPDIFAATYAPATHARSAPAEPVAYLIQEPNGDKDLSFDDLTLADREAGYISRPLYEHPAPAQEPAPEGYWLAPLTLTPELRAAGAEGSGEDSEDAAEGAYEAIRDAVLGTFRPAAGGYVERMEALGGGGCDIDRNTFLYTPYVGHRTPSGGKPAQGPVDDGGHGLHTNPGDIAAMFSGGPRVVSVSLFGAKAIPAQEPATPDLDAVMNSALNEMCRSGRVAIVTDAEMRAPTPQPVAKVKDLMWRDTLGVQTAKSLIGSYAVFKPEREWQLRFKGNVLSRHPDEESAKAAAQQHYDREILSAFAPAQEPVAVPAGFVLVPVEPTPDMCIKGAIAWSEALPESGSHVDTADACYKAMLAAAPSPPADSGEVERLREALERISALTPERANAGSARSLHLTVKAIADSALASASDSGEEEAYRREMELREIADGAYGDAPAVRGAARDALASTPAPQPGGAVKEDDFLRMRERVFAAREDQRRKMNAALNVAIGIIDQTEYSTLDHASPQPEDFAKGAEAMRALSATYHDRAAAQWRRAGSEAMARIHDRHAKAIRALPLPTQPAGEG